MCKISPRAKILALEPGTSCEIDFADLRPHTASYYASHLGRTMGRRYWTRTVKERSVYVVTREA